MTNDPENIMKSTFFAGDSSAKKALEILTIRTKTILILGLTLTCLLIGLYLIATRILMGGFSEVEETDATRNVERVRDAVESDISELDRINRDWASWDDTYAFMVDRNQAFVTSNLDTPTTWSNNRLNLMIFVNGAGEIIYKNAFDLQEASMLPVSENISRLVTENGDTLLTDPGAESGIKGLILLPEGPMLISSQPILTSEGQGPSRGSLIWGRFLDADEIARISLLVHLPVTVQPVEAPELPQDFQEANVSLSGGAATVVTPLTEESVAGYTRVEDVFGRPAIMLRADMPRDVYNQGRVTLLYYVVSLFAVGLLFGLITIFMLERSVILRMARISARALDIGQREDHSARIEMKGKDEVSRLASFINKMLAGLERSQKELYQAKSELDLRIEERTAQLRAMQTLADIDREIASIMKSRKILELACRRVSELLGTPKSAVVILDEDENPAVGSSFGCDPSSIAELEKDIRAKAFSEEIRPLSHGGGYPGGRLAATSAVLPLFTKREKIGAYAASPLIAEKKYLGALLVFDIQERPWTGEQMRVLDLISAQVALALDQTWLFEQERERRSELASLYGLSKTLADTAPDTALMLDIITKQAVETISTTFAQVALLSGTDLVVEAFNPIRYLGGDQRFAKRYPLSALELCAQTLGHGKHMVISDPREIVSRQERRFLLADLSRTLCLVPLQTSDRVLGLLILGEERKSEREPFTPEKMRLADSIADQTVSALRRAELFSELEAAYLQAVMALANAVDAKDTYTADHGKRLAQIGEALGREIGLTPDEIEDLRLGAILHDVGKIGIPDHILQKPGPLNEDEWKEIRMHPVIGEQILEPIPRLARVAKIVRHHHEWYNGAGYPDGLAGRQIPLGARILSVVDSYCAIVDLRVYKEKRAHAEAVKELEIFSGTQFDPEIVERFKSVLNSGVIDEYLYLDSYERTH